MEVGVVSQQSKNWLLLIHQIPPKPNALRVKIWRRLQQVGAVAIKQSVYVMPYSEQSQEDLSWTLFIGRYTWMSSFMRPPVKFSAYPYWSGTISTHFSFPINALAMVFFWISLVPS